MDFILDDMDDPTTTELAFLLMIKGEREAGESMEDIRNAFEVAFATIEACERGRVN